MKITKFAVSAALILVPLVASPIGRSGNGKLVGMEEGFSTLIPPELPETEQGPDGSVKLSNSKVMDSSQSNPAVLAERFAILYPTRAKMDRDSLKVDLLANGWNPASLKTDPCVDLYYSDRGTGSAVIAVWGEAKGVAFISSKSDYNAYAVDEMIQNLTLDKGACAWK